MNTILELLQYHSNIAGNRQAFIFLPDGEGNEQVLTFEALNQRAKSIAGYLQSVAKKGDRCLIVLPAGLEYICAYFGCLYAGVIAVPIYPPRRNRNGERAEGIISDCEPVVVLTSSEFENKLRAALRKETGSNQDSITLTACDSISNDWVSQWKDPIIDPNSIAFLQYTSGSTGNPKGVMVSHANLLHNCGMMVETTSLREQDTIVSWLPMYHDMGLIGNIILTVYHNLRCVLMPSVAFIQRPFRWLRAISKYKAYYSGGPNFAYDLCIEKLNNYSGEPLDLSSWQVAYNGSEPVRAATLHNFYNAFSKYRLQAQSLRSSYGMAEATLFISSGYYSLDTPSIKVDKKALEAGFIRQPAEGDEFISVVSCGKTLQEQVAVIVNPVTRERLPDNQVGEIWLQGLSVAKGYWNQPDSTERIFQARLSNEDRDTFLRTGDLGFLRYGELFVTGRLKDILIIRGRNHYPQDIEFTVQQSHPALKENSGAAFSVESEQGERVVVVQEIEREAIRSLQSNEVFTAIRKAVAAEHDLQLYDILLLLPGEVPKTSSGKIQRSMAKLRYNQGTYRMVAGWLDTQEAEQSAEASEIETPLVPSVPAVAKWLTEQVARLAQLPTSSIDPRESFDKYGLDSMAAVQLAEELSKFSGQPIAPTLVYDFPSIEQVALQIGKPVISDSSQLVPSPHSPLPTSEPMAIVGMACRFPGADDLDAFWSLLQTGKNAISRCSTTRNDLTAHRMSEHWGGYIHDVEQFDSIFFGISPREASYTDPQQRLLLEVAWQALENASIPATSLAGRQVGVFVGISSNDYGCLSFNESGAADVYSGTGNAFSIAANRLSYLMDLRGPSMAVDTACSSSLVAVHQACQSLRNNECELAIVGGVNLLLNGALTGVFAQAGMLAADGLCKTFDASADGYVRGEGCGVVIIKPLHKAQTDGDRIWAVIRGTAVNQDGRSNGMTAPNGVAQQVVIKQALAAAQVEPYQIGYVEAHGTGTGLGDPIEINALASVLGQGGEKTCYVGSVKTNIGHLEAAAGIAGLIKTSLVLAQQQIPPLVNFKELNPHINIDTSRIRIPTTLTNWSESQCRRLAGVSSFGFGGTNAHLVLEEAPLLPDAETEHPERSSYLVALSAKNSVSLQKQAAQLLRFIERQPAISLPSIGAAIHTGRVHFRERTFFVASHTPALAAQLEQYLDLHTQQNPHSVNIATAGSPPKVAFLFTGQGAQYPSMAASLYASEATFKEALDECNRIAGSLLPISITDALFSPAAGEVIHQTHYTQPVLFAVEYALCRMWRHWGVEPVAIMGHSLGEYVAACIAGVWTLEDALRLVITRATLMQALPEAGSMLSVQASQQEVEDIINLYPDEVSLAAINGPRHVVVAGQTSRLQEVVEALAVRGIQAKPLQVSHGFHSPLMQPMLSAFREALQQVEFRLPVIPFISNVSGEWVDESITTPEYWCKHILVPVQFYKGVQTLVQQQPDVMLEIGPQPVLTRLAQEFAGIPTIDWLPSLKRTQDDWTVLNNAVGKLYKLGADINWMAFEGAKPTRQINLPGYPFDRQAYWLPLHKKATSRFTSSERSSDQAATSPFSLERVQTASRKEAIFCTRLAANDPAYLHDHCVHDRIICPASVFVELTLNAFQQLDNQTTTGTIQQLHIGHPLLLRTQSYTDIQLIVSLTQPDTFPFEWLSWDGTEWQSHARGDFARSSEQLSYPAFDTWQGSDYSQTSGLAYYAQLTHSGLSYGPAFQAIVQVAHTDVKAWASLQLPAPNDPLPQPYLLHPVILDAAFQAIGSILPASLKGKKFISTGFDSLYLVKAGAICTGAGVRRRESENEHTVRADIYLYETSGDLIAAVEGIAVQQLPEGWQPELGQENYYPWLYQQAWLSMPVSSPAWLESPLPITLKTQLKPSLAAVPGLQELPAYGLVLTRMEQLSIAYAVEALEKLDWTPLPGTEWSANQLTEALRIVPQHNRLFCRILDMMAEEGYLERLGEVYRVVHWESKAAPTHEQIAHLVANHGYASAELTLLHRCGSQLAEVLTGQVEGVQLIFPEGDTTLATQLYHSSPGARVFNQFIAQLIGQIGKVLPAGRQFRVLEIGAGTGATTSYALPAMPVGQTSYVFTDISALFLNKAKEQFGAYSFVDYQLLNIEQDPEAQGLSVGSFDVVIAANVLHATKDVAQALRHIRKLLVAGGYLVVWEGFKKQRWLDLIFGLTDGWWRFEDTALRPDYPLLPDWQWEEALAGNGFSSTQFVLPEHDNTTLLDEQGILVCQAEKTIPNELSATLAGQWLVVDANEQLVQVLTRHMQWYGGHVTPVHTGLRTEEDATFYLNSEQPFHYPQLLTKIQAPIKGVIFFTKASGPNPATIDQQTIRKSYDLLVALRSIAIHHATSPLQVYIVTKEAYDVGDGLSPIDPVQASLAAVTKVLDLEYPFFDAKVVDFTASSPVAQVAQGIIDTIVAANRESSIAYRDSKRFVSRLNRLQPTSSSQPISIQPDKAYVVSGGTGGLGLLAANWLIQKGAKHLYLVSRRGAVTKQASAAIASWRSRGVQVVTIQADVTVPADIHRIQHMLNTHGVALGGIIHTAGTHHYAPINRLTAEEYSQSLEAKVKGAVLLNTHLGAPSAFFIAFSSTTALWGGKGLAAYTAANQFLDGYTTYLHQSGIRAISVNWGPWKAGMLTEEEQEKVRLSGLQLFEDEAMQALDAILATGRPQVVCVDADWKLFRSLYESSYQRPFLSLLEESNLEQTRSQAASELNLSAWRQLPVHEQAEQILDYLRNVISHTLRIKKEQLEIHTPLQNVGLDSLVAMEIKNRILADWQIEIEIPLFMQGISIAGLMEKIQMEAGWSAANSSPSEPTSYAAAPTAPIESEISASEARLLLSKVDQLPEEEMNRLLSLLLQESSGEGHQLFD